ncbi:uncharacterized protein LOC131656089 [Vicia villosa]|uniref:uncharacterized protein LOC131656089 n=1 Tax=Vicia villosa TaxID=3911 RepID=UPI00273C69E6|nr:uncharacterized protein LOC131656089 [Vicia villosa]
MSVLVNGSPTKEFTAKHGLRQGDPLSPFLFVLAAEGLTGLVKKAKEVKEYSAYQVKEGCTIDVLQFPDDTLLIDNGVWKQIWTLKSIIRDFELVSGLGVNFYKSKVIGINLSPHFLPAATNFLCCRIEEKEVAFLGLPIGSNPRKISSWKYLCLSVEKGGLGLKNTEDFNSALLLKWKWRILEGRNRNGWNY